MKAKAKRSTAPFKAREQFTILRARYHVKAETAAKRHAQIGLALPVGMFAQTDLDLTLPIARAEDSQGDPVTGLALGDGVAQLLWVG